MVGRSEEADAVLARDAEHAAGDEEVAGGAEALFGRGGDCEGRARRQSDARGGRLESPAGFREDCADVPAVAPRGADGRRHPFVEVIEHVLCQGERGCGGAAAEQLELAVKAGVEGRVVRSEPADAEATGPDGLGAAGLQVRARSMDSVDSWVGRRSAPAILVASRKLG